MEGNEEAKSADRSRLFLCDPDNIDRIARDACGAESVSLNRPKGIISILEAEP